MSQPLVSIIIVTWNTAIITKQCISSIKNYLDPDIYEIILVDNNSSDNTSKIFSNDKSLTFIKNLDNFGFSKANNIGASVAKGQILFFLNSDMRLIDNSTNNMVKYFQNNKDVGIIGPQLLNPDLSLQASVFPPQTLYNAFREYWLKVPQSFTKKNPQSSNPVSVDIVSGGAILIRQNLFKQVGGWNEKYHFYFEDLDLCRSVKRYHQKIIFYPKCRIIHHHGASGIKISDPKNQWRRLISGSKQYHGLIKHQILSLIIKSGQKLFKKN